MERLLRIHLEHLATTCSAEGTRPGATSFLRRLLSEPRPVRQAVARDLEAALATNEQIARRLAELPRAEAEALGMELLTTEFGPAEEQSAYERLVEDLTLERTSALEWLMRILRASAPAAGPDGPGRGA